MKSYEALAAKGCFPSKGKADAIADAADFEVSMMEALNTLDLQATAELGNFWDAISAYRGGRNDFDTTVNRIEMIIREYAR